MALRRALICSGVFGVGTGMSWARAMAEKMSKDLRRVCNSVSACCIGRYGKTPWFAHRFWVKDLGNDNL